jgi:hypothetical protein
LNPTDEWHPDCWCGAALKICDQHIDEGNEFEDYRYPEQWMYLLWRPTDRFVPFMRPDGWGLTIGHPRDVMRECVPENANVYILADRECVWSSWLQIPLVCARYEPWLVTQIKARKEEQKTLEATRYAQWYGNEKTDFEKFLGQLVKQP